MIHKKNKKCCKNCIMLWTIFYKSKKCYICRVCNGILDAQEISKNTSCINPPEKYFIEEVMNEG